MNLDGLNHRVQGLITSESIQYYWHLKPSTECSIGAISTNEEN